MFFIFYFYHNPTFKLTFFRFNILNYIYFFFSFKGGAKGILCINNGTIVQLNSFATSGNDRPEFEALSDGYKLTDSYVTSKKSVVCKFTQTVNVPSGSENLMHSLAGPLHNLIARGDFDVTSGHVSYHHKERLFTDEKIDVTPTEVISILCIVKTHNYDKNCNTVFIYYLLFDALIYTILFIFIFFLDIFDLFRSVSQSVNLRGFTGRH